MKYGGRKDAANFKFAASDYIKFQITEEENTLWI